MIIMGIDPGTAIVGWGIIKKDGPRISLQSCGAITTPAHTLLEHRLVTIYDAIQSLLTTYQPKSVAIERLFFATNAKTAIDVAQARGVILLACAQAKIPVVSYAPLQIKRTITGDGNADKKQIQFMLTKTLKIEKAPEPDDVSDAVAIALTHAYTNQF